VRHLNQPSVINGYAIFAGNAEHEVWDISNPYRPVHLADMISNHRAGEAESHQVSYARYGNTLYMVTISGRGIDIWNVSDTRKPMKVSELLLPGINYGDVSGAIWGLSWQGRHIYVGATTDGLHVVNVTDPARPSRVATLSQAALGGVQAGPLFALGNLLVVTTPKGSAGIATVDISHPAEPRLLDAVRASGSSYIGGFYGKNAHLLTPFRTYDVTTDPANIRVKAQTAIPTSEYMSFADNHLFLGGLRGGSEGVWKYDITNPGSLVLAGRFVGRDTRWDDQFSCPVGNLLLIADDQRVDGHYVGGLIVPHSAAPDTTAPRVLYANPSDGASNQPLTTRIGLSLSEWPELASASPTTFFVRPVGGAPLAGTWSCTYTTLTFSPDEPLLPGVTYEVVLPAGGIKDFVGNGIAHTYTSTFTTEAGAPTYPANTQTNPVASAVIGETTTFSVNSPDPGKTYLWKFGDGTESSNPSVTHAYNEPGRYIVTVETRNRAVFEAEDAVLAGGVVVSSVHSGYSGAGFADFPAGTGAQVYTKWTVDNAVAGSATLTFRYANGSDTNRPLQLVINGGTPTNVDFPATGAWTSYHTVVVPVTLRAGSNNVRLQASAGSGGPNLDSLGVSQAGRDNSSVVSFRHVVHRPLTPVSPTSAQAAIHDAANNLIWTVNTDTDTVSAVSTASLTKTREVPVGAHPTTLAKAPDGTLWVVNRDDATLSILNALTGAVVETIALTSASQPVGIAFAPDGSAAYVTLQALGRLLKIDPATRRVVATCTLPLDPNGLRPQIQGVAVTADGAHVLMGRFISPDTEGQVFHVNAATMTLTRVIPLANDPGPDSATMSRGIPNYLTSLTVSPDGARAWVPSKKDNIARGIFHDGQPLQHDRTVRAITSSLNLATFTEVASERVDYDDRDRAHAVAFSPLGDLAFVAMPGNNHVSVHDAYSGAEVTRIASGKVPVAVVIDAHQRRLFILNHLSRSLSAYDISSLLDGGTTVTPLGEIKLIATERLSPQVLRGKELFYDASSTHLNSEGYMSCASCHLDGYHDGRTWDLTNLGEGLRNTINLRGHGGTKQGRLHWSGNFDEVQDFENQIRALGEGKGLMTDADFHLGGRGDPLGLAKAGRSPELDALAAYVASLNRPDPSPYRNADGTLTTEAIAGRHLYNQLRCFDCHGGEDFTDSRLGVLHDVGTLKVSSGSRANGPLTGLDTPSLVSVWSSAPYLHDGSAPTLRAVLTTANPQDRHGVTRGLSSLELDRLVAYLQQIDGREPAAAAPAGFDAPNYETYLAHFPALTGSSREAIADPDQDGFPNLAEYALGASLADEAASMPLTVARQAVVDGRDYLTYSFLRLPDGFWEKGSYRVGDVIYSPLGSQNLQEWLVPVTELPNPAGLPPPPGDFVWMTIGCELPAGAAPRFLRIGITRAP
jgi:DNA-binding beta-propeller fold protein YncE